VSYNSYFMTFSYTNGHFQTGGHIYNLSKLLTSTEFKNLRLHTIHLCEQSLNRPLSTFEREIFLFPRLCYEQKCREWRGNLLLDCDKCGQVSFQFALTALTKYFSFSTLKFLKKKSKYPLDITLFIAPITRESC
jgi:hypothetical protein